MTQSDTAGGNRAAGERGMAFVGVILLLFMMTALAGALGVSGRTETLVSRNHASLAQARGAAEAGLNHALQATIGYLRTIDPDNIPNTLDSLLVDTTPLAGVAFATTTPVPGAADPNAEYEVFLMDEDDPDREDANTVGGTEDGNEQNDTNNTIALRAVGHARNNAAVAIEALIAPAELGAIVVDGNLDVSGNVTITGSNEAHVHANGDLTVDGSVSTSGSVTASGEYDGPPGGYGGAAEKPLPEIRAADYEHYAKYVLSENGQILCNSPGGCGPVLNGGTACNPGRNGKGCVGPFGWEFDGPGAWSIRTQGVVRDTFYVEGRATITSAPQLTMTIIAEGSISISGKPSLTAHTNELLFVTDGDLNISGGTTTDVKAQGQMLVHEQISLSGTATLGGQLIVENAPSQDPTVANNSIRGNVTINYNGTLGTNMFFVTAWREIR